MNFVQKLENLAKLKELLAGKKKQLGSISKSIDAASEEEVKELEKKLSVTKSEIEETEKNISDLQKEIDADEAALKTVAEGIKQNKKKEGTQMNDYLKTKQAAIDYATLMADAGSAKEFKKAWEAKLVEKQAAGLATIMPKPILLAISEAFEDYDGILNHVSKDPRYAARFVLQKIKNFGKGHTAGKAKKNAEFAFEELVINSATVYTKYAFDYADLKKDTNGTYFNYAMKELAKAFIRAVERAVVVGDGLAADDDDKITEIKSIAEETKADLFDTQEIDTTATSFTDAQLEALVSGTDKLLASGTPVLVTTKAIARKLKLAKDADGKYTDPQPFAPISNTGNSIQGFTVYCYDWMETATNPIIGLASGAYTLIGDQVSADRFDEYDVTINRRDIELASVMGGRLSAFKAAVKYVAPAGTGA
ncbi:phage major capsid protein [Enterococcus dispar]|uniref:phage major capsid protein n=1 Tax=Enterococcus dispar TaxID=44009 RepID=UPI00288CAEDF|nr:phage major capsid protein [Enterococcus dispar]MDT2705760.1 phage major capsid protein [Enterococcus dispar]